MEVAPAEQPQGAAAGNGWEQLGRRRGGVSGDAAGGGGVLPAPVKRGSGDGDTQSSRELAGGAAGARR